MPKTCIKCGVNKPASEFYKHPMMRDGRLSKCKDCAKTAASKNYRKKRKDYAYYDKMRNLSDYRKVMAGAYQKRRRARSPEKYKAVTAAGNAIRDGRLLRQPCQVCGKKKVEAHHADYSKPLEVRWLCRKHHLEHHGKVSNL